jgi:hypothetical protein
LSDTVVNVIKANTGCAVNYTELNNKKFIELLNVNSANFLNVNKDSLFMKRKFLGHKKFSY